MPRHHVAAFSHPDGRSPQSGDTVSSHHCVQPSCSPQSDDTVSSRHRVQPSHHCVQPSRHCVQPSRRGVQPSRRDVQPSRRPQSLSQLSLQRRAGGRLEARNVLAGEHRPARTDVLQDAVDVPVLAEQRVLEAHVPVAHAAHESARGRRAHLQAELVDEPAEVGAPLVDRMHLCKHHAEPHCEKSTT